MKEFQTAVREKERETDPNGGWVEFKIDDQVVKARPPNDGQIAYAMAGVNKRAPLQQQVATAINFICAVMDVDSQAYLSDRLLDQDDDFGLAELTEIMQWLTEEWSGRPTEPASASAKQPQ